MRVLLLLLLTVCACLASSSVATAANLAEIYQLALENDPQLGAAEATFKASTERKTQARSAFLPNINVSGNTSDGRRMVLESFYVPTQRFNSHSWQARVTQPVFRLDAWFAYKQVKDLDEVAKADLAIAQQAAIVRAGEAYFQILQTQDQLTSELAERDAVQRQLEQVQQRFDVGLVAITDVLEATAAYDAATVDVIDAEGGRDISFERLVTLTGENIVEITSLSDDFPVAYPIPNDENAWVEAALDQNFSIKAAEERVKVATRSVQIARSGHFPTVDAAVIYSHNVTGGGDFFGSKTDSRTMALQVNVPVFSGGRTHSQVKEAIYNLEVAQKNLEFERKRTMELTRSLFSAINTHVARVSARQKGIESSQSALDAIQTGYEVGTRNIVDVLVAQQRLFSAIFAHASARYTYILDTLRLKQLAGTLSPEDIEELNQFLVNTDAVRKNAAP